MIQFHTANELSETLRTLMRTNREKFPKNVKTIKWTTIGRFKTKNILGMSTNTVPITGKIIHLENTIVIVQKSPSKYCVIDRQILPNDEIINEGDTIWIAPYVTKGFDGIATDAARTDPNNRSFYIALIGNTKTTFPGELTSEYLQALKKQLECLSMPDDFRTISNAMADWQASNIVWTEHEDQCLYNICFDMTAPSFTGTLRINYDRGPDSYSIDQIIAPNTACSLATDIYFDDLANQLSLIAGDHDCWFFAKVQNLSAMKRHKRAA